MRPGRAGVAVAALVLGPGGLLSGCSADSAVDPQQLLIDAQQTLASTESVHVLLSAEDLPDNSPVLQSADGVAAPPDAFQGEVRLAQGGLATTVPVISVGGTVYAQLPFTSTYTAVDPEEVGVTDPAALVDAEQGLASLLTQGSDVASAGQVRIGDTVLEEITATLDAATVAELVPVADSTGSVAARYAVDAESAQLRRAELTGPFYPGGDSTYIVELDRYGEPVDISAPSG